MKLAIIDIGSNSVRLLLATYENNIWHYEPKQLWTTRLGQRNADGTLRSESMESSYQAFKDIKKLADQYGADYCFGFATSAVREAQNGLEFMESPNTALWNGEFYQVMKKQFMDLMVPWETS